MDTLQHWQDIRGPSRIYREVLLQSSDPLILAEETIVSRAQQQPDILDKLLLQRINLRVAWSHCTPKMHQTWLAQQVDLAQASRWTCQLEGEDIPDPRLVGMDRPHAASLKRVKAVFNLLHLCRDMLTQAEVRYQAK